MSAEESVDLQEALFCSIAFYFSETEKCFPDQLKFPSILGTTNLVVGIC